MCVVIAKEAERIYKTLQNPQDSIGSFNIYHMCILFSIRVVYLTKLKNITDEIMSTQLSLCFKKTH